MSNKVVPYKTSAGVEIGKNYNPVKRREFSADEERIQKAFISHPLDDGLEDIGRMAIICLVIFIGIIVFFTWVTL